MESVLRVSLPETLHSRTYNLAAARGESVEDIVREALEQYITVAEPLLLPKARTIFPSRTALGRRLRELRAQVIAAGEPLLDWDELRQELAERRGEREHAETGLR
jgi:hypothetical protein